MVGVILPDCGGAWVPDTGGGGGEGTPAPVVLQQLVDHGQKGIVFSGLVAWIEVQLDSQGCEVWRSLAERTWLDHEVTLAKDALKASSGQELETLVPEFKTSRTGAGKKTKEIEDIRKAIVALQNNNSMPLVLASSGMMGRCPSSWGKVHMLEEAMACHMDQQAKQMEKLCQEVAAVRAVASKTPSFPGITLDILDTPSKKRKINQAGQAEEDKQQSYAGAALAGVQPIGQQHQKNLRIIQSMLQQPKLQTPPTRQQKNICFGTSKTSGDEGRETLLAANVDLVASGVGKDCTNENLKEFLINKGIDVPSYQQYYSMYFQNISNNC